MNSNSVTIEKARILLVDDNADVRTAMRRTLAHDGSLVVEADNGDTAMHLIRSAEPFDLLVTDLRMPGPTDGLALAADWERHTSNRPVLLVSGDAGAFLDDARLGPNVALLHKPFRRACLTTVVQRLLQDTRVAA